MLKRWPTSRGIRWTIGGSAAIVLGLAITWGLFVPVADWLAHHDVGSVKGALHETAVDNARGRLLTLGAGLFAAGALVFTARNYIVSRRTLEVTEQGQVTDRYTKAIEQLGSKELDVRIGGIYALERVARDSARDHPTVMEVLTAFIREHSREQWPLPAHDTDPTPPRTTRPDVQAALTVVGRRDPHPGIWSIDLTRADLTRADLTGADLASADLTGANLASAILVDANLSRANLTGARLGGADLMGVDLKYANLLAAHLDGAHLASATLFGANLTGTHLTGAHLSGANLTGAHLSGTDLTGAHLDGARWPGNTPIPEGWRLNPSSGRLERARYGSGPTEAD